MLAAIRPADVHFSPVTAVCVENSNNSGSGSVWPVETLAELSRAAKKRGLAVHMDGARLWNAAVASGVSEKQYATFCDTVSVCFSKGLGAPVGSALVGSKELIERARRFRKMWGGGMRQVGILAAGALYALRNNRRRMHEDHANARKLAEGLASIKGVELLGLPLETNIVRFRTAGKEAAATMAALRDLGVLVLATGSDSIRAVTHLEVGASDVENALKSFARVLG
jgi:threonine aldolase